MAAGAAALLLVAFSAPPAGAAAGDLDPSFATGGASLANANGGKEIIRASTVQPDGKIVSAGFIGVSSTSEFSFAAFVARHHPDGVLDASEGAHLLPGHHHPHPHRQEHDLWDREDPRSRPYRHSPLPVQGDHDLTMSMGRERQPVDRRATDRYAASRARGPGYRGEHMGLASQLGGGHGHRSGSSRRGQRTRRVALAVTASVAWLAAPAAGAGGDKDPAFGSAGTTTWSPTASDDWIAAVTHQPDGKIVSAGWTDDADVLLSRHNTNGTLDADFGGGDGVVLTDLGGQEAANAVTVQPDGKIVVAGCTGAWLCGLGPPYLANSDHLVARYNADGTPDSSFGGGDGVEVFGVPGEVDGALDVAVEDGGRILAAGFNSHTSDAPSSDMTLVALNADGTLDSSFGGGDGMVVTDFSGRDMGKGIALQRDGSIVVAGFSAGNFAVARFLGDGTLDNTFSDDGKLTVEFGGSDSGRDVAIDANDRIVVAGRGGSSGALAVLRLTPSGTLDPNFSGDGRALAPNYLVYPPFYLDLGVQVQVDGKVVAGGTVMSSGPNYFGAARFTVSGALDPSFSGDGVATVDVADGDRAHDVSIDIAGNIVVAGATDLPGTLDNGSAAMVRFLANLAASACPGLTITNTVAGTPGDDTLVGTPGSDFIYGLAGNDTITGGGGKDCIYGGTGDDILDGGEGKDRLFGEAGNDTITGGTEVDKTEAGPGDDTIRLAAGDVPASSIETLKAKGGTDTVELGAGLTTADVNGSPPTFTVTDPSTGGSYSAVLVEVITDT